jgi:hypothetical protein
MSPGTAWTVIGRETLRRGALALLWIGMRTWFHDASLGIKRSFGYAQSFLPSSV